MPGLDHLEIPSGLGVFLKLVSVAENLVVRLCFADHELLIYLIPSYQPGTVLVGENVTFYTHAF